MEARYTKYVAAAVQAAPVFLDREATIDKACKLIAEAARNDARLVAFSEAWVPTFPYWPRGTNYFEPYSEESREVHFQLIKNAVEVPSKSTDRLCRAARDANVNVMIGISEVDPIAKGTLYNTQLYINNSGEVLGTHRKLVPTGTERVVWARGDGSGLRVFNTDCGKVGGLICFENFMPLARMALMVQGQQVHLTHFPSDGSGDFNLKTASMLQVFCRYYAYEAQVFVINVMGYLKPEMIPDTFPLKDKMNFVAPGGSVIISPSGDYLAGPIYDEETILYAEIDLDEILRAKAYVDTVGHYARWDVTQLLLNTKHYGPFAIDQISDFTEKNEWKSVNERQDNGLSESNDD